MSNQSPSRPLIHSCKNITQSIWRDEVLNKHFLEFTEDGVYGEKPKSMPSPMVKPVEYVGNHSKVLAKLKELDLKLTWARIDLQSQHGTYYSYIALFGDRCWVTLDRSGYCVLRIFDTPFA